MGNGDQSTTGEVSYLGMAAWAHRMTAPAIRAAIRALQLPEGSQGLDVACGIGTHTLWLAEATSPDGQVIGMDISRDHLARARQTASESELSERVSFRCGDMYDLPFGDDSFDWVWNADTLWLASRQGNCSAGVPLPLMKELARVVRPGGTIAILFWSSQRLLPGYPLLEARLNATRAANYPYTESMRPESHILRTLGWLQRAGLDDPKVRTFVADVHPPLNDAVRRALTGSFQMLWGKAESEVSPQDWARFQRLCQPDSQGFILDLADFYAFITYSLFYARVPR